MSVSATLTDEEIRRILTNKGIQQTPAIFRSLQPIVNLFTTDGPQFFVGSLDFARNDAGVVGVVSQLFSAQWDVIFESYDATLNQRLATVRLEVAPRS